MRRKSIHPDVYLEDLAGIYDAIREDYPEVAEEFIDTFERTVTRLCEFPEMGVRYFVDHPDSDGLRMFLNGRFRNYLIFYKATEFEVRILYVVHGASDLDARFESGFRV